MNTKLKIGTAIALVSFGLAGCTGDDTSVGPPAGDSGIPPVDSSIGSHDGSTGSDAGNGRDATAAGDSSAPVDSSSPTDSSSPSDASSADTSTPVEASTFDAGQGDAGACAPLVGSFAATDVKCNGAETPLPSGFTWVESIDSNDHGVFTQTYMGCQYVESGPVVCSGNQLVIERSDPTTCNPVNCSITSTCGQPANGGPAYWTVSNVTANSFVITGENDPDGGPFPIQTCTGQGKQNPLQVTFTRQ